MVTQYKYDGKSKLYYLFVDNKLSFGSPTIAICYSYSEDDHPKANLLRHGLPSSVKDFYTYITEAHKEVLGDESDEIFYYENHIPVDELNSIIQDPSILEKYHKAILSTNSKGK